MACSLVKTSYNNAPALTIFWLDDYFSFTQSQQAALKPSLQKLHQWHRQTQLPEYISLLQDMQTSLAKQQLSADEICDNLDEVKSKIHTLQLESIPIIIEMTPLLSDKQLQRFQNKLEERAKKWKADWWQETIEEQLEARVEKTEDFAEDAYGDLSDAQISQLKQSLVQANVNPAIRYKEIQRRNDDAFSILNNLQSATLNLDEKMQLAKAGFNRLQKSPDQAYQTYADVLTKHTCETMANLHASTTPKQKLHAKNWLQNYIDQITAMQN
jgi:Family of unknown function (DUF6279)